MIPQSVGFNVGVPDLNVLPERYCICRVKCKLRCKDTVLKEPTVMGAVQYKVWLMIMMMVN